MSKSMIRKHFDWTSDATPEEWLNDYIEQLSPKDQEVWRTVLSYVLQSYSTETVTPVGEPLLRHLVRVAEMIAQMNLMDNAVLAVLCSSFPQHLPNWQEKLTGLVDDEVIALIIGLEELQKLTEFVKVNSLSEPEERITQAESMRKMLLAMVSDIRVVIIKLAMRTRTMHFLGKLPDSPQKRNIAKETLEIFAPLANRLGVWQLKWQLEDLGFRYQEPEEYRQIAEALDEKRNERIKYIDDLASLLRSELNKSGINCDVAGRPKHIYSIYRKMQKKKLPFSGLYDIRAVRVLVENIHDCYNTLGIVHSLWQPISGEFDDYISHPKSNDYRSLHTVVVGPEDKGVEIQIRTFEMHEFAEMGVAAHWRYKEGGKGDGAYEQKIAWLRQLLDWRENMAESGKENLANAFQTELFQDTIYTLTPQGKVISLPQGATPIDFAYALHTNIGDRCRGAKVNGQIVPLSTALENGQKVEIITTKEGNPSVNWLHEGWVKSHKAITKIRSYVRKLNDEFVKDNGKEILEKALSKVGTQPNLNKLAEQLSYSKTDDLYLAIGRGDISTVAILKAVRALQEEPKEAVSTESSIIKRSSLKKHHKNNVLINGEDGLMTTLAKCCKPAPPDDIIGFVTKEKGISIHRTNCLSFQNLANKFPDKVMGASWANSSSEHVFAIDICIKAHDRSGLLRDVSDILSRNKINVTGVQTRTKDSVAVMTFTVEVKQVEELPRVLTQLTDIKDVLTVQRL